VLHHFLFRLALPAAVRIMPVIGWSKDTFFAGVLAMTEQNSGTIRAIAWSEVFPWLKIVRAFRLAISVRALVLGALGILLTATGWGLIGRGFGVDSDATRWLKPFADCSWTAITKEVVPDKPGLPLLPRPRGKAAGGGWKSRDAVAGPWKLLTQPAWRGLNHKNLGLRDIASVLLCGLWGAAVWALFGAAICRGAAVQLAADEQIGWGSALRFAARKWPSYFFAPLMPIGGVLLATVPILVLGWIIRSDVLLLLGGLCWPLVLAIAFAMTVLLLWVLFGWPLMWGAISAEGSDSFDALSRSNAYMFQRPLNYLFYAAVAAVIGGLGWILVRNVAAGAIWMSYWAAAWGSGAPRIDAIMTGESLAGLGRAGAVLIHFWVGCVKLLAVGYLFSYFWTASTAVYFQLRRDVDHTEMDEVFLDADQSEPSPELPPISKDPAGAPVAEGDTGSPPIAPSDHPPEG